MEDRRIVTRIPLIIDAAMVLALLSLSYWVGTEANKVDNMSRDMQVVQTQITVLNTTTSSALNSQIVALQVRADGQERLTDQWRSDVRSRLDRIERKLDKH